MSNWYPLFFNLQIICYLVIYEFLPIPSSSIIFIEEITKSIEFESLNPVGIIRLFNPEFNIERWLKGKDLTEVIVNKD